jgi:6-pyruvoyltetrahydropterin 2'-reductase
MVKQIISAESYKKRKVFQKDKDNFLNVSEFFYDTIQGEGIYAGIPAAFLRLQNCTLECIYCDSTEVWRHGSPYTFNKLSVLINSTMLIPHLTSGMHLVITGGSPLLQMKRLYNFIRAFELGYGFHPFIEIENECIIAPPTYFAQKIDCWNNSPKLSGSGMKRKIRYQPAVIQSMSLYKNSWFKFVVESEEDWEEIQMDFLEPGLIYKPQIILMPQGATREELNKNRETVVNMSIQHGVRYSDRLHIVTWDRKVGV